MMKIKLAPKLPPPPPPPPPAPPVQENVPFIVEPSEELSPVTVTPDYDELASVGLAGGESFRDDAAGEAPLPPPPPQIGKPVGLPPPDPDVPADYDGLVAMAADPRVQKIEYKMWWASMAQAAATKEVAERLGDLLEFLGAYGAPEDDSVPSPRLSEEVVDGVLSALALAAKAGKKK